MNTKTVYEPLSIEITLLHGADVITTSGAFNGLEDVVDNWKKR